MNKRETAAAIREVRITDARSSYCGRVGKVVGTAPNGDIVVTFEDKPHLEMRFFKGEYEVVS